jgi:DNA repair protein SbcC/Rad50
MIKSAEFQHFQSHKKTVLKLHPHVNAIIGSSNSGKTALLRGLYWTITNRPSGNDFVSHWNRNKKGEPIEPSFVKIENDAFRVERFRTKTQNGYRLNDAEMEAIRTDVPESVSKALNIEPVNISRQMDPPFLLSESSGEVARFFNKIIRLDIIDRVLSAAESAKRKNKQAIETQSDIEKTATEAIKKYNWIESAQSLINKAERVQGRILAADEGKNRLKELIKRYQEVKKTLSTFDFMEKAEMLVDRLEPLIEGIEIAKSRHEDLSVDLICLAKYQKTIENFKKISGALPLIGLIENIQKWVDEWTNKQSLLAKIISAFTDYTHIIKREEQNIQQWTEKMPNVCPVCGGKL